MHLSRVEINIYADTVYNPSIKFLKLVYEKG